MTTPGDPREAMPTTDGDPPNPNLPRRRARGCWWVLASGLAVVAVLVLLAIAGRDNVRKRANAIACAKNQNSIVTACIAYSGDFDAPWPLGVSSAGTVPIATPHQARLVTARSFEVLAATMSLPNGLFRCSSARQPAPRGKARADAGDDAWGGLAFQPSYAFDWAAPGDPDALRTMTADRSPDNHGGAVMAAHGDGHAQRLKVRAGTPRSRVTEDHDGRPLSAIVLAPSVPGEAAGDDNIFDDAGDGGVDARGRPYDPCAPAAASPRRAWLK